MGAKSSNKNRGQNNISDGHLLSYSRNTFIRGGGGTVFIPLSVSGGIESIPGNGYKYYTFTSSGTLSVSGTATNQVIDFLVVAGGGGGGTYYGGGGGGGGVAYGSAFPIIAGSYPIVIGGGGAAVGTAAQAGTQGTDTTINFNGTIVTAKGGGAGGFYQGGTGPGAPGGSGGGGGSAAGGTATQPTQNPGIPQITNYGFKGGDQPTTGGYGAQGGGGSGAAAANAGTFAPTIAAGGGNGGAGQPFVGFEYPIVGLSTLAPVANSPTNNQYAGGGGGGQYAAPGGTVGYQGLGGNGGGGSVASSPRGLTIGISGLGGGGAGGHPNGTLSTAGGSGVVIVRILI